MIHTLDSTCTPGTHTLNCFSTAKMPKCQWSIAHLKKYMTAKHGAGEVTELFYAIQSLMVRSLLAVQNTIIQDKHCFELYGYDVMFDEALDPWLIEVNASPSLTANTRDDYVLKCEMLNDTLDIVDVEAKMSGDERSMGGFDLVYDGGVVEPDPNVCPYATRLGCAIERPQGQNADKQPTPKGN